MCNHFAAVEYQMTYKDMTTLKGKPWYYILRLSAWLKSGKSAYLTDSGTLLIPERVSTQFLRREYATDYWEEREKFRRTNGVVGRDLRIPVESVRT